MIMLERIANLPKHTVFSCKISKTPCEDAEYVYFHKSLKYYSCYFNVPVVTSKRKGKKRDSS